MESQPQNPEFMIKPENFHPCLSRVRATDRHCPQMRRNNKFGTKNMNLATIIGERKFAGEIFFMASERLLRHKIIALCRLMVINVYLNCQLTPQLSATQFGS